MLILDEIWGNAWKNIGTNPVPFSKFYTSYNANHRHYHNQTHIIEGLLVLNKYKKLAKNYNEIVIAWMLHDIVYDVTEHNNEEMSAAFINNINIAADKKERIKKMILATKHDGSAETSDEKLIVDIDLSILASSPERFREYDDCIRKEYSFVPDDLFKKERLKILNKFLSMDKIYYYLVSLESVAKKNLKDIIEERYNGK